MARIHPSCCKKYKKMKGVPFALLLGKEDWLGM